MPALVAKVGSAAASCSTTSLAKENIAERCEVELRGPP
jgi:hypothetical protein